MSNDKTVDQASSALEMILFIDLHKKEIRSRGFFKFNRECFGKILFKSKLKFSSLLLTKNTQLVRLQIVFRKTIF